MKTKTAAKEEEEEEEEEEENLQGVKTPATGRKAFAHFTFNSEANKTNNDNENETGTGDTASRTPPAKNTIIPTKNPKN